MRRLITRSDFSKDGYFIAHREPPNVFSTVLQSLSCCSSRSRVVWVDVPGAPSPPPRYSLIDRCTSLSDVPKHRKREWIESESEFLKNNLKWVKENALVWRGQRIDLHVSAEDSRFITFDVCPNQPQLLEEIPNERLLVKMFKEHNILTADVDYLTVKGFLNTYREMQKDLPMARLLNVKEADDEGEGCGFFLFEKPCQPFILPWTQGQPMKSLNREARALLDQLKAIFETTYTGRKLLDVHPSSFGLNEEGKLILTEFPVCEITFFSSPGLNSLGQRILERFGCRVGDSIYNYLYRATDAQWYPKTN